MGGADPSSAWGPPQAPMGMMQGPNGQMGGPPMNIGAPMGPSMMQGYQGWGTSPQQQSYASYGTPSGPGSYQGWGAPPAPQGPPPQWGNNYGGPPQQQGYGSYGELGVLHFIFFFYSYLVVTETQAIDISKCFFFMLLFLIFMETFRLQILIKNGQCVNLKIMFIYFCVNIGLSRQLSNEIQYDCWEAIL